VALQKREFSPDDQTGLSRPPVRLGAEPAPDLWPALSVRSSPPGSRLPTRRSSRLNREVRSWQGVSSVILIKMRRPAASSIAVDSRRFAGSTAARCAGTAVCFNPLTPWRTGMRSFSPNPTEGCSSRVQGPANIAVGALPLLQRRERMKQKSAPADRAHACHPRFPFREAGNQWKNGVGTVRVKGHCIIVRIAQFAISNSARSYQCNWKTKYHHDLNPLK
jgi:hypothetical protein